MTAVLYHFSEEPAITSFAPRVPPTNPSQAPAVWAIDAEHAPLYWFPRDCPRVTAWARTATEAADLRRAFTTTATRVHAIECGWLSRVRTTTLYRYSFDATPFAPWPEASGQWISTTTVEPVDVTPVGDLLEAHAEAEIELRTVPHLWPLHDFVQRGPWDFSIVRMANARPRPRP